MMTLIDFINFINFIFSAGLVCDTLVDLLWFLLNGREPEGHHTACRSHHHVLRVELNTLHRVLVVSVKNTNFLTVLRVPDVDSAVTGAGDDKLGIRREGSLQWKLLGVEMTCKGLKRGSAIGVNELDH